MLFLILYRHGSCKNKQQIIWNMFWEGTPTGTHLHSTNADLDYHLVIAWNHMQSLHKDQHAETCRLLAIVTWIPRSASCSSPSGSGVTHSKWDCNGGSLDISWSLTLHLAKEATRIVSATYYCHAAAMPSRLWIWLAFLLDLLDLWNQIVSTHLPCRLYNASH